MWLRHMITLIVIRTINEIELFKLDTTIQTLSQIFLSEQHLLKLPCNFKSVRFVLSNTLLKL